MTHLLYLFSIVFISTVNGHQARRYQSILHVPKATEEVATDNTTRCFHYTWLADSDDVSFLPFQNKSCFDKYGSYRPMPLCVNPMVVTDNGNEPDSNWLVDNKYPEVTCRLSAGYTCAKYSYYFNGKVQNVTRYCTKISIEDSGSMESGCISASSGAYQVEVCACNSMLGKMPCNSAISLNPLIITLLTTFAPMILSLIS